MILFLFLNISGCSTTKNEREPNNGLLQAQEIVPGDVIKGLISNKKDKDYYSLNVTDSKWINKALHIVLEHGNNYDLALDIYIENKLIKTIDNYASINSQSGRKPLAKSKQAFEVMANLALYPGSYHFVIRPSIDQKSKVSANYKISFFQESRSDFSEIEPNDSIKSANLIENNIAIEGFFSPGNNPFVKKNFEIDFYKVVISATNKTLLSVEVSGVPGIDSIISIYDNNGRMIKESNNSGLHIGEKIKNIGIKKSGTYYISLKTVQLFTYNNKIPYSIRVETTSYSFGEELEPNDKLKDANPIKIDEKISGMISALTDEDYFSFIVPQPGSYMFSARLKDLLNVDTAITIYNSYGKKIREFNSAQSGQAEYIANIGIKTTKYDEKYFIKVHSKKGYNDSDKYEMIISLFESSQQGEYEPNDNRKNSNGLIDSVKKRGFIYPQNDIDWYSFSLKENKNILIEAKGIDGVNLVLTIFDNKGKKIRSANGSGLNENEKIKTDLQGPAVYYLTLSSLKESQFNVRSPYQLLFKSFDPITLPIGVTQLSNVSPQKLTETNRSNM